MRVKSTLQSMLITIFSSTIYFLSELKLPQLFQCTIEKVLSGIDVAIAYIDDILIHAPDIQTMKKRVKLVLERLGQFHLKARFEKSEFFTDKDRYLGYFIDQLGIHSKFKNILCSDLITHSNQSFSIKVSADASNNVIGACISHMSPDGSDKAKAHASRTLKVAEEKYC